MGVGAIIAIAVAGPPACADECIQPSNARVFASASGGHIFRVAQKDRERPEGTLVAISDNFDERRVWCTRLINVPARILVADDGDTAVGIDNAGCRFGSDHSVVIYGKSGRVVADYVSKTLSAPPISVGTFTSRWRAGTGPRGRVSRSALMTPRWSSRSTGGG
jgi:hypothetical protein